LATKHITFGLFEATNASGQTLARNLIELLKTYELKKKIVAYVKDEGSSTHYSLKAFKQYQECE